MSASSKDELDSLPRFSDVWRYMASPGKKFSIVKLSPIFEYSLSSCLTRDFVFYSIFLQLRCATMKCKEKSVTQRERKRELKSGILYRAQCQEIVKRRRRKGQSCSRLINVSSVQRRWLADVCREKGKRCSPRSCNTVIAVPVTYTT